MLRKMRLHERAVNFFGELWRLVQARPTCHRDFSGIEEFQRGEEEPCLRLNLEVSSGRSHITAILGEWGSGKTVFVRQWWRQLEQIRAKNTKVAEVTFFGVSSYNEALFHLTSWWHRLIFVLGAGFCVGGGYLFTSRMFPSPRSVFVQSGIYGLKSALVVGGIMFFINRGRWLYLGACLLEEFPRLFSSGESVFIVEDLDRSSMPEGDRWSFLGTLWSEGRHYVVTYGYSSEAERVRIVEALSKIEATIIHLPFSEGPNFHIARQICRDFPFKSATWITLFSAREIAHIAHRAELEIPPGAARSRRRIELLKSFHAAVVAKISRDYPRPDRFPIQIDVEGKLQFYGFSSVEPPITATLGSLSESFAGSILRDEIVRDIMTAGGPDQNTLKFVMEVFPTAMSDGPAGRAFRDRLK